MIRKETAAAERGSLQGIGNFERLIAVAVGKGEKIPIFGFGSVEMFRRECTIPWLAYPPISLELRKSGDRGLPLVYTDPDAPISRLFETIARQIAASLDLQIRTVDRRHGLARDVVNTSLWA